MNGDGIKNMIEYQISPWLRLITPVILALILFFLNASMSALSDLRAELKIMNLRISDVSERVRSTERAIGIYHPSGAK